MYGRIAININRLLEKESEMSLYNMLFGMNGQTDLLLAVIGLKQNDIQRFRDVSVDGDRIAVYTRTGGNNREVYPNLEMRKLSTWVGSADDDFDNTYCTDNFKIPAEFIEDVKALDNPLAKGLRKEFGEHLLKTLNREPTESDKNQAAYDEESSALRRTKHFMANGHTFVPVDDYAMETALKLAESNNGELRSCWGIMPLNLMVKTNFTHFPNAKEKKISDNITRAEINYDYSWKIDTEYWNHCVERFTADYPITMGKISEEVSKKIAA